MREVAAIINKEGNAVYWNCSFESAAIQDSKSVWQFIWENRDKISGAAHSHPGTGVPVPSNTDLTTFKAIDAALGLNLTWWIVSANKVVICRGDLLNDYAAIEVPPTQLWLPELRKLSNY